MLRPASAPLRVWRVLRKMLIGVISAAAIVGLPGIAAADSPPPPNINAFPSAKPSEYAVQDGAWYAFGVLDGVTCVLDKQSGGYGCSGPIPGGPGRREPGQRGPVGQARIRQLGATALRRRREREGFAAEHPAQLPDRQLRHRRKRHHVPEHRRSVRFRPQPRRQLHVRLETLLTVSATHRLWRC